MKKLQGKRRSTVAALGLTVISLSMVVSVAGPAAACDVKTEGPECVAPADQPTEVAFVSLPGALVLAGTGPDGIASVIPESGTFLTGSVNPIDGTVVEVTDSGVSAGYTLSTGAAAAGASGYSCINNKTNNYFRAYTPIVVSGSSSREQYRYQFNPYQQYFARTVSGRVTYQFEICATGGYDGQNGWRSFYNASIMSADTNDGSRRIGLAADSGSDGTAVSSLNVSASGGPITISGSIPTTGGGVNFGQYGRPKYGAGEPDAYPATESFAGWRSGCTYSRTCGSSNMQAQVHNGLFEFNHGDWSHRFPLNTQWNYYCSGPYGRGCG